MKKSLVFLAVVSLVAGVSFAQAPTTTRTIPLELKVLPYVELNMAYPIFLDFGTITPPKDGVTMEGGDTRGPANIDWSWRNEFAYANCPYNITLSGDNPANDGVPCFAKAEIGLNPNGFDRLITRFHFHFSSDYNVPGTTSAIVFNSAFAMPGVWNATTGGYSVPHTGEVYANPRCGVSLPAKAPNFGVVNTWNQSADAGTYQASITVTITAGIV